jgi:hypothetical protein
MEKLHKQF